MKNDRWKMENGTPQVEIGLARNGNRPFFKDGFILFEDSPPQAAGNVQL